MPKFTIEERLLDEQDTLEMLKQGINQHVIAAELGKSVQHINNIKKTLVAKGLITDEQIKEYQILAYDNRILEMIIKGEYLSTIIRECRTTREKVLEAVERLKKAGKIPEGVSLISNNAEEKSRKKNQNMEKLLELILKDVPLNEIIKEIGLSEISIYQYAKELIRTGRLDPDIWEEAKQKRYEANAHSKKKIVFNDNHLKKIIAYLRKGYTPQYIAKLLDVNADQVMNAINYLRDNGYITQKEIHEIRTQTNEKNRRRILYFIKNGYSLQEIMDKLDGVMYKKNYVRAQIKHLINEKKLTEEDYEEYKKIFYNPKKIKKFVLDELKKGSTYEEMIETFGSKALTLFRAQKIKSELVKEGKITEEEIIKARKRKQEDSKESIDSFVLKMLIEGKTIRSMVEDDESGLLTMDTARKAKHRLISEGKITTEEVEKYKKKSISKTNEEIDQLVLNLILQGKTHRDILKEYPYIGSGILVESKKRLYSTGKINDEVLKQIADARKNANLRKKINSLSNFDNEVLIMLKRGCTFLEIRSILNLSYYMVQRYIEDVMKRYEITDKDVRKYRTDCNKLIRELRKATIKGKNADAINRFFRMMEFYAGHGRSISQEDIEIMENAILNNQDCLLPNNLKFIIMYYINNNALNKAKIFINKCIKEYNDTCYIHSLKKFRDEIKKEEDTITILKLTEQGFSTSAIAEDLRIREIDVIQILKKYSKNATISIDEKNR